MKKYYEGDLPSNSLKIEWEDAPEDYVGVRYNTVYPKIKKTKDGKLIIDQLSMPDGSYKVKIFNNEDHLNLKVLLDKFPNAPKVIKQIYKREYLLRKLRATDFNYEHYLEIENAWITYIENLNNNV